METGLTKNRILSELSRSPHGKLAEFLPIGKEAAAKEPAFLAHLISWNRVHGQVRDSQVALPVVSLTAREFNDQEYVENSLAHMAALGPRQFLKAYRFALEARPQGWMTTLERLVEAYLREREALPMPKFERIALQHRSVLKELYRLGHVKPADAVRPYIGSRAEGVVSGAPLKPPKGSLFEAVAQLASMSPSEAAGTIINRKLPFIVVQGALGKNAKEKDLILALIGRMSATELVTNMKMLERFGVKKDQALRGALAEALAKASGSTANVLKTTRAAEVLEDEDEDIAQALRGVQEKQIEKLGGVDGNWLVLGDKSGSMNQAIEAAREVSATLAKMVKGRVWLVFFDVSPMAVEVTGLALDQIKAATRHITADNGTSIGCGLQRMLDSGDEVDGIAIVSDAQENTAPLFADVYKRYSDKIGKQVPVYLYRCHTTMTGHADRDLRSSMQHAGLDLQEFDLTKGTDYYALPNLVKTMRTQRYGLIEQVMAMPLVTLKQVFSHTETRGIIAARKEANAHA